MGMEQHCIAIDQAKCALEESENKKLQADEDWQQRLAEIEDDLKVARDDLRWEQEVAEKLQMDGEHSDAKSEEALLRAQYEHRRRMRTGSINLPRLRRT